MTSKDCSTNQKIAHLPRKLTGAGSIRFGNVAPGDLCYYAPCRRPRGLGRLDGGPAPLLLRVESLA
ncbi:cyclophilin-like fold protein [Paracoccus simplex]|uniref:Cyclophilin-like fold protein n=1 Tax=Paracoccus simplex TaxID=2086346 RepID=A0ABV7RZV1_9RHOB